MKNLDFNVLYEIRYKCHVKNDIENNIQNQERVFNKQFFCFLFLINKLLLVNKKLFVSNLVKDYKLK